jgi:hypothetical protein
VPSFSGTLGRGGSAASTAEPSKTPFRRRKIMNYYKNDEPWVEKYVLPAIAIAIAIAFGFVVWAYIAIAFCL